MPRGPICIAVTGAIGLTTEAIAAAKGHHNDTDKALAEEIEHAPEDYQLVSTETLISLPVNRGKLKPLAMPVIIPERRPRHRRRGFLRAYAPLLENCQINQTTFLSFLKGFDEEIKVYNQIWRGNFGRADAC
jgi:hypothetical protein